MSVCKVFMSLALYIDIFRSTCRKVTPALVRAVTYYKSVQNSTTDIDFI